jgi:hypothetical protein
MLNSQSVSAGVINDPSPVLIPITGLSRKEVQVQVFYPPNTASLRLQLFSLTVCEFPDAMK